LVYNVDVISDIDLRKMYYFMNFNYQKYALKQIENHNKSILIWFRQSGKSKIIVDSIIDYTSKNYNKIIYVCVQHKKRYKKLNESLNRKLNISMTSSNTSYLNNCTIKFNWYDNFEGINPDFVIYDDFEYSKNVDSLLYMIDRYNPKVLLTTSQYVTEVITYFDREGDYYLNVVSSSSILTKDEILERKNYIPNYNVCHEYGNIEELYDELGIKKDRKLIDVWGLKVQRRKKLEEIAKKIKISKRN